MKRLLLEMAAIVAVAVLFGLALNHRLLMDVWSGRAVVTQAPTAAPAAKGAMPLPAGLPQVKDLYNRKGAVFVDARDDMAYSQGHIRGAVSLPVGDLEARLARFMTAVPPDSTLVIYCSGYGCHDSMSLAKKLAERGYQRLFIYEGGYPEWKDSGLPTEGRNG